MMVQQNVDGVCGSKQAPEQSLRKSTGERSEISPNSTTGPLATPQPWHFTTQPHDAHSLRYHTITHYCSTRERTKNGGVLRPTSTRFPVLRLPSNLVASSIPRLWWGGRAHQLSAAPRRIQPRAREAGRGGGGGACDGTPQASPLERGGEGEQPQALPAGGGSLLAGGEGDTGGEGPGLATRKFLSLSVVLRPWAPRGRRLDHCPWHGAPTAPPSATCNHFRGLQVV